MKMLPCHLQEQIDAGNLNPDPFVIARRAGKLYIFRGCVVTLTYDDDGKVLRRTCTIPGRHDRDALGRSFVLGARVHEDLYDPPLPEMGLPPLPQFGLPRVPTATHGDGAEGPRVMRRDSGPSAARTTRRIQSALGGYMRKRKKDED